MESLIVGAQNRIFLGKEKVKLRLKKKKGLEKYVIAIIFIIIGIVLGGIFRDQINTFMKSSFTTLSTNAQKMFSDTTTISQ